MPRFFCGIHRKQENEGKLIFKRLALKKLPTWCGSKNNGKIVENQPDRGL